MNGPPPVRFPIGNSPQLGAMIGGLWILALIPVLTALALHVSAHSHGWALSVSLAAFVAGAGLSWRFWRDQTPGVLIWSGAQWLLEKDGATTAIAHPGIRFDGQRWLLLRTSMGCRAVWLWAGRSADPVSWHALRCALYAQAPVSMMPV